MVEIDDRAVVDDPGDRLMIELISLLDDLLGTRQIARLYRPLGRVIWAAGRLRLIADDGIAVEQHLVDRLAVDAEIKRLAQRRRFLEIGVAAAAIGEIDRDAVVLQA